MPGRTEAKLAELGIMLPVPVPPIATYVPYVVSGKLAVISGQLPMAVGRVGVTGKLGRSLSIEQGQRAARTCFINVLAQLKDACGELDRVTRIVRLGGYIACDPDFTDHAKVMNGASDLAVAVFGDKGRHARTTIGVAALPLDAAVEIEGMFELG